MGAAGYPGDDRNQVRVRNGLVWGLHRALGRQSRTLMSTAPVKSVGDRKITTIEGLSANGSHKIQRAWIAEQVPQCGYCQSGQIMQAAALLQEHPHPTVDEINTAMARNICRCATYQRIRRAIERTAVERG